MKKRAFIRYELKTLPWVSGYFMLFFAYILFLMNQGVTREYIRFLERESEYTRYGNPILGYQGQFAEGLIVIGIAIGVALLIYTQFRDTKNIEVGRFLKALPFSSQGIYKIKVGMGILSFTIPYLIFATIVLKMRSEHLYWIKDWASVSLDGNIILESNSLATFLGNLSMYYGMFLMMYAFGMMMQYIISNKVFSIAVTAISFFVPVYLVSCVIYFYGTSGFGIINDHYTNEGLSRFIDQMMTYLIPFLYASDRGFSTYGYTNIQVYMINQMAVKIVILLVLSATGFVAGYFLVKKSKIEDAEVLISFRWARNAFVIGTSVCSFFFIGIVLNGIANGELLQQTGSAILLHVGMLIGAIIVGVVSKKIAYLGHAKK